ncbi:MAG: hypothetical protein IPL46_22565 [Saprospiraceae bacterium]|nr:hypothetical protein [Saprospiraceae bacterium]
MKVNQLIPVLLLSLIFATSCENGGKDGVRDEARKSLRELPPGSVPAPAASGGTLASSGSVPHYVCPKNCQGSGGPAAGTCPVCGSEYEHNQAYHNQTADNQPINIQSDNSDPVVDFSNLNTGSAPSTTAEPAQNATGVWHYTCANGCAGGAGAAGKCATCGGDLAHNTAYHGGGGASSGGPSISLGAQNPGSPPASTPEPAQNAAGVWHYTCPSGCAGGGGSATKCATCGKTLAHNTAYH